MEFTTSFFLLTLLTTAVGKTVHYTGRNLTHVPIDYITPGTYTVKLSDNKISHLGSFNTTPYIRYLYIDNNQVNHLSPQTFQRLCELRVLDLDRNYIVSLRDFVFSDLAALWNLLLSNNLISAISERAFHGLASLEFLELSGNRLSAVPMQAIRLIPSEQLLLVSLAVNSISEIPGDIQSAHPSASYQLQGNPLRCPDEQVSRGGVFNFDDSDEWPMEKPYVTYTEHNRSLVERFFIIKSRFRYFGVFPNTFYLSEHISVDLPSIAIFKNQAHVSYFWTTPIGRYMVESITEALTVADFTAEDSGMYRKELVMPGSARTRYLHWDMLLCLNQLPKEKKELETTMSPTDDFSPHGNISTDICAGSTNRQSCCSYWLTFKPSIHQKFCVDGSPNSQANPVVTVVVVVNVLVILFGIALFCCSRKRQTSRSRGNSGAVSTTLLHTGLQAMAVGIPLHILPELTEDPTEGETNTSAFPLRQLRSRESHWSAMKMRATQYSLHRGTEAPPADAVGTTDAQVHHYDNDDEADEEFSHHHGASAVPPPQPVYEETAVHAVDAYVLEGSSEQPAFQIENAETGEEEELPYGVAAANSLYQRDSDVNRGTASIYYVTDMNQIEERHYATAETNALYQRDTGITDVYGQQTDYIGMARDINTTSRDSVEDFGILYGSTCATPVEQ
ncbi:LGR6 [Branchiostoma lanceolatum]|uniref:LGR6 protein n=1 Tax=Branchiostoma lanceolatum TaxID=7740 RepID=A0A8J9W1E8_BRALA|nr:LGR6 [Branchiostoma lanceolatum]